MKTKNNTVANDNPRNNIKNNRWSAIGYVAIAFACAVALWFYVADYDRIIEKDISNVPVELVLPADESLSVESGMDNYITVKVSGKKADVMDMTADDLRAYVDASGVKDETDRAFDVQVDVLREGISVINTRDIPSVTVVLVKPTVKNILVVADIDYTIDEPNYIRTTCAPQYVTVKGSANLVNSISAAEVSTNVGKIEGNISTYGKIVLKDEAGNIVPQTYLTMNETDATVYIDAYTKKELPIEVEFTGGVYDVNTAGAEILCVPDKVTVNGPLKSLQNRDSVLIEIDEKEIEDSDYLGVFSLPDLSEHVNISYEDGVKDVEVSITQNQIASTVVTVHAESVIVENYEGYDVVIKEISVNEGEGSQSAQVLFRGFYESIRTLTEQKLELSFDLMDALMGLEVEVGTETMTLRMVPVKIGYSGLTGVFTTDEVFVTVEITPSDGDASTAAGPLA